MTEVGVSRDEGVWDGDGGPTQPDPAIVSKNAFDGIAWLLFIALAIATWLVLAVVERHLGRRPDEFLVGVLIGLCFIMGRLAADRIFKALGMSRSGKAIERRGPAGAVVGGDDPGDGEVVEIRIPESWARAAFWICIVGGVAYPILGTLMFSTMRSGAVFFHALGGLSAVGAISYWCDRKPHAWVDRDGITGYSGLFCLLRRSVPWSDVAACEIVTYYNPFGQPVMIRPFLKGRDGKTLMALNPVGTTLHDQERLAKAIRAKLPKLKEDPWE